MKKSASFGVVLVIISLFSVTRVHAQAFEAGTNVISGGLGLGSSLNTVGSPGIGLSATYERGIWEAGPGVISLGGYIGYTSFSYSGIYNGGGYDYKWNYTIIGARGAWHFTGLNVENLDLYGGLMLSYDNLSFSASGDFPGTASYSSGIELSPFAGARYYFANDLGVYGELGFGVSVLNIGLSYKF